MPDKITENKNSRESEEFQLIVIFAADLEPIIVI